MPILNQRRDKARRTQSGACFKGLQLRTSVLLCCFFPVSRFDHSITLRDHQLVASVVSCLQSFLSLVFTIYPTCFLSGQTSNRKQRDAQGCWAGTFRGREKNRVVWPYSSCCMAQRRGFSALLCLSKGSFHYNFLGVWQRCFSTAKSPEEYTNFLKILLSPSNKTNSVLVCGFWLLGCGGFCGCFCLLRTFHNLF